MTQKIQHCQLIGYSDSGDYVYTEIDLPSGATNRDYIVEELRDGRFRLWRIDLSITTSEDAFYRPDDIVGLEGLESAGFATVTRFPEP